MASATGGNGTVQGQSATSGNGMVAAQGSAFADYAGTSATASTLAENGAVSRAFQAASADSLVSGPPAANLTLSGITLLGVGTMGANYAGAGT